MVKKSQPQPLIGGMIAGTVLNKVLDRALDRVLNSPQTYGKPIDAPVIKEAITQEASKEIISRAKHEANQEPFYKSRVTVGSLFAVLAAIADIGQKYFDGVPNTWDDYSTSVGVVAGALFALYGRWVATKPIGE